MDPCTFDNIFVFISNAIIFDKVVPWAAQGYDRFLPKRGGWIINFIQMYTGIWKKLGEKFNKQNKFGVFPNGEQINFCHKNKILAYGWRHSSSDKICKLTKTDSYLDKNQICDHFDSIFNAYVCNALKLHVCKGNYQRKPQTRANTTPWAQAHTRVGEREG